MHTKTLKNSLWGYSKTSVCEYIAQTTEEFSQKMLDTLAEKEKTQQELREKIIQLEKENERLRNNQDEVAAILLDAKLFAAQLHSQAELENQKLKSENKALSDAEAVRIQTYQQSITVIRNEIRRLFKNIDTELNHYAEQLSDLKEKILTSEAVSSNNEDTINA